jgi:cyclohexanone monooxygenase
MDLGFYSVYTKYPKAKKLSQMAEKKSYEYLREAVDDPELHDVLTPEYVWGCKRPTFSNRYYQMYNRDNVELVTDKILRVEPDGVVTVDGTRRPVDVLICATGYRPFEKETIPTYPVYGKGGVDVRDYWDSARYQAFRGFAVHNYPNFFLLYGPYAVNGSSYFTLHEVAVRNILRCLTAARTRGADYIEVTPKSQARDFAAVLSRQPQSIFHGATCAAANTIYIDRFGDTPYFGPWTHPTTWLRSKVLSMKNFTLRRHTTSATSAGPAPVLSAD